MKRITVFLTIICSLAISQACGQKQKVSQVSSLTVQTEYGKKTPYDKTARLTDAQYRQFLNSLAGQSIKKNRTEEDPGEGGSQTFLMVYQNSSVLFKGEEGVDITVGRGSLGDSFRDVLPSDMRAILDNPERAKINNIVKKIKKI